jgi:apolipoprotein N-acyltransferase
MSPVPSKDARTVLAAFLLGAATVLGFAPAGFHPLPIFALAALLYLWQSATTPRRAGVLGFAFGSGLFLTGVSWIYVSLHDFGMMPAPLAAFATLVFCSILALFPALVGYLQARIDCSLAARQLLLIPALWTLSEWVRGWMCTGFPWLTLGYSQAASPLAGYAALIGVFGLSWLMLLASGLLLTLARQRVAALSGLALLLVTGYGLKQVEWTQPQGEPVAVSLLQGNIPQDQKWDEARYAATLELYLRMVQESGARLTILPETAIPRFLDRIDPEFLRALAQIVRQRRGDLIIGVPLREQPGRYFNSVISAGTAPAQRYDKAHLVPLGEFIPPGFGWIINVLKIPLADFTRGGLAQAPLALAGQRVAVNICYEDAFGEEIIGALPEATLLANVSNVAWFGDSLAPHQHLQISQMRSLETGRTMLRATNTGMTAIIGHHGEITAVLPAFTQGTLTGSVQGRSGATPYVRWGNFPVVLLALIVCGACILRRKEPPAAA